MNVFSIVYDSVKAQEMLALIIRLIIFRKKLKSDVTYCEKCEINPWIETF